MLATIISDYVESLEKILRFVRIRVHNIRVGPLEFELKQSRYSSYEETIDKIEKTKGHLKDAIEAVDTLQSEITTKKKELDYILDSVRKSEKDKERVEGEYQLSRKLLSEDSEKLKEVLGFYKITKSRTDKVNGFIGGVLASLVAAGIWALVTIILKKVTLG
jgi:chromosome segregation ATPase